MNFLYFPRWFLKSCPETVLVGGGKDTSDLPFQIGEKMFKLYFILYIMYIHTTIQKIEVAMLVKEAS